MKSKQIIKQAQERYKLLNGEPMCDFLTGKEDIMLLINKLKTTIGIGYAHKHSFPTIDMFRQYRIECFESGICVDSNVEIHNEPICIIIGKSSAKLYFNDPTKRYEVLIMHGARVDITAENYTFVVVYNNKGTVNINKDNTAIVYER